jgi:hypothetical protein
MAGDCDDRQDQTANGPRFLLAVLSNDLEAAVMRADDVNRPMLATYIDVLVNYAPATAFGSRENVRAWMDDGARLRRQHLAEQS